MFKSQWKGLSFFALSDSNYSKGVAILFNPKFNDISVLDECDCGDGRTLIVRIEINDQVINLINTYAPNSVKQRCEYFANVTKWINKQTSAKHLIVLGGDMNCCLELNDRSTNTHSNDKSRDAMKLMIDKLCLNDV